MTVKEFLKKVPKTETTNVLWALAAYAFAKGWIGESEMALLGALFAAMGVWAKMVIRKWNGSK